MHGLTIKEAHQRALVGSKVLGVLRCNGIGEEGRMDKM